MDRKREKMGMLYEKGGKQPDRCRKCLNYRRKVSPSELTNTNEQFIVYVHRNEAHFTYIYVYHTKVSEADNIYKNSPPNVISSIYCFAIFISLWGSTHDQSFQVEGPQNREISLFIGNTIGRFYGNFSRRKNSQQQLLYHVGLRYQ